MTMVPWWLNFWKARFVSKPIITPEEPLAPVDRFPTRCLTSRILFSSDLITSAGGQKAI